MDPYKTLGIEKDATQDQIKRAYKRKASKCHPDKGGDKIEFQKLQNAYSILNDERKRLYYDQYGIEDSLPDLDQEALKELSFIFSDLLDNMDFEQIKNVDIIDVIKKQIEENIKKSKVVLAINNKQISKFEKVETKMSKDYKNIFANVINNKIKKAKSDNLMINRKIELCDKILLLLKEFEFSYEKKDLHRIMYELNRNEIGTTSTINW